LAEAEIHNLTSHLRCPAEIESGMPKPTQTPRAELHTHLGGAVDPPILWSIDCAWQVVGRMSGGAATLTAARPSPLIDKCGVAAAASITATRKPNCTTTGQGRVELRK
jgi:hypothetical protein